MVESQSGRSAHPSLFLALYLPFNAPVGFLSTALEYYYSRAHVDAAALGGLVGLAVSPHVFKVLWAPAVDTTLNPKLWYVFGMGLSTAGLVASGMLTPGPASLPTLALIVFTSSLASTFAGMASESLMAHTTAPQKRGAAGGWSQAGSVGGSALSGGAGLWLATHLHSLALAAAIVGGICALCPLVLFFAPRVARFRRPEGYLTTLKHVGLECWSVTWSRVGLLTLFLLVLPLGSNGAGGVFTAVSKDWGASADLISGTAWITGLLTLPAAIAGGHLADHIDRRTAYALFGLVQGLIAAGMALAPREPLWFVVFVIAYSASTGLAYAGYAAVTLEAIGAGAAATKFNLFASISNIPVTFMPILDGWAAKRWSPGGMLWLEFATAFGSAALYGLAALATRRFVRPRAAAGFTRP